jgi:hypothetical protein
MGGKKEVWNVGSEHENMSSECEREDGNCEDTEVKTDNRSEEQRLEKMEKG